MVIICTACINVKQRLVTLLKFICRFDLCLRVNSSCFPNIFHHLNFIICVFLKVRIDLKYLHKLRLFKQLNRGLNSIALCELFWLEANKKATIYRLSCAFVRSIVAEREMQYDLQSSGYVVLLLISRNRRESVVHPTVWAQPTRWRDLSSGI
jgi:hypothetical protein